MGFKKVFPTSSPISRPLHVWETHQHIDDHAPLHADSLHKELSGPILRLIPENIQIFIVVPLSRQQFWFFITGTRLRRHQGWEEEGHEFRTQKEGPYRQSDLVAPQTRARRWDKMSKALQQVRGLGPRSLDSHSCSSHLCLCHTALEPVKNLQPCFNNNLLATPLPRIRPIISR